jgi:hypothetical protein
MVLLLLYFENNFQYSLFILDNNFYDGAVHIYCYKTDA